MLTFTDLACTSFKIESSFYYLRGSYAYFEIINASRGTFSLSVDDVVLDGYRFDRDNRQLSASIKAK